MNEQLIDIINDKDAEIKELKEKIEKMEIEFCLLRYKLEEENRKLTVENCLLRCKLEDQLTNSRNYNNASEPPPPYS